MLLPCMVLAQVLGDRRSHVVDAVHRVLEAGARTIRLWRRPPYMEETLLAFSLFPSRCN